MQSERDAILSQTKPRRGVHYEYVAEPDQKNCHGFHGIRNDFTTIFTDEDSRVSFEFVSENFIYNKKICAIRG